jgi:hypothetical protein
MKLITRDKANEIATFQNSKENIFNEAIEYVNNIIEQESNKGNFKTSILCSMFNHTNEIRKFDICDFVIDELIYAGYNAKLKCFDEFSEEYICISWE